MLRRCVIRRIAMSVRSALFAGAAFAAAVACQQRDRSFVPPPAQTAPITPLPETTQPRAEAAQNEPVPIYEPSVDPAPGTAAPYGAGAIGGVAIETQEPGPVERQEVGAGPSTTRDRQGRAITVRRRTTTNPSPSATTTTPPAELTTRPTDDPTDRTMRPDDALDPNPDPGISDTSTQSTRPNPDSQDQGIGGGDTYDRNR
jgi:hypothetical protein